MGFGQAISSGFSNYVNFFGRACRSEYWFWVLFTIIAQIATGIIDAVIGIDVTTALFGLATFLPEPCGGNKAPARYRPYRLVDFYLVHPDRRLDYSDHLVLH